MTAKQALKAAKKRGLLDKKTAELAAKITQRPKSAAAPLLLTEDVGALKAEFKAYHEKCPVCHGADPFCHLLGSNGSGYLFGRIGHVIQVLRREQHKLMEPSREMPEAVKQALRQRAAERKATQPPRVSVGPPTDRLFVCGRPARPGTFREQLQQLVGKAGATMEGLVKQASNIRNVRGKVASMLEAGTLVWKENGTGNVKA